MTIELNPVGVTCNLSCPYCYEHPIRDAGNAMGRTYDMEAMKRGLEAEGGDFTVFGGEPLLMRFEDLEEIFRWGFEKYGKNCIQTNGALITEAHIALFKKYAVHVGMSLDGPGELNNSRWAGSMEKTLESTRKSQTALERCLAEGVGASLIITLHRGNGLPDARQQVKAWLHDLDAKGLQTARLHLLEVDHPSMIGLDLTPQEALDAMLDFGAWEKEHNLKFDVFQDCVNLLRGTDVNVTCVFTECDPFTTDAVHGVDGDGMQSNCGRATKDGVNWRKAEQRGYERQLALYRTPQAFGGCQGCRFFVMCKGQCPGTAIDGDWRNRSAQCATWMGIFGFVEGEMIANGEQPLSLSPLLPEIEAVMLATWGKGLRTNIASTLVAIEARKRGEVTEPGVLAGGPHGDKAHGDSHGNVVHGDAPHGDSPHGDKGRRLEGRVPVIKTGMEAP